jgi:hypothetical protein
MASIDNNWLTYPASIRITLEEKHTSNQNILIGSDQDDPTYSRWVGTFVVNNSNNFYIAEIKFSWPDIDKYPKLSPEFDFTDLNPSVLAKIKNLFDSDNRLVSWDESKSISDNLKQIYTHL